MAFVGVIVLAYILRLIIHRLLNRIQKRLAQVALLRGQDWLDDIFKLLKSVLHPLLAWALGVAALRVFQALKWGAAVLAWLVPLLLIWLFYWLAWVAVSIWVPAERAKWVRRRIVLPIGVVTVILYALGFLDDVLTYRSEILQAGVVGLIYLLSRLPVAFLKHQLERLQKWVVRLPFIQVVPILKNLVPIFQSGLRPLSACILGTMAISIFDALNAGTKVLQWAVPFFIIWFGYETIHAFLTLSLSPERRHVFTRVLRIVTLAVVVLHAIGRLATVWELGLVRLREDVSLQLGAAIVGVLIIYVSVQLSRNTRQFLREMLPQVGMDRSLAQILATLGAYAIAVAGIFIALSQMRIDLSALTIIIGGFSVGIGFALQGIIANFLSGFILMFERAIVPGDVIQMEGGIGIIEEVGLRSIRIRTPDNIEQIVPNERFLTDIVTKYGGSNKAVCVHLPISVSPDADPHQVQAAILRGAHHPDVLDDPAPAVAYVNWAGHCHDFELLMWAEDATKIDDIMSDVRMQVWDELVEDGIGLPVPV
jgi:small-conductance mechanosensitive channel